MLLKRRIAISLIIIIVLMPLGIYAADNIVSDSNGDSIINEEKELITQYGSDFWAKQAQSNEYYEALIESFKDGEDSEPVYPDYYGGSYIDDDRNFVVYVKGNGAQTIAKTIGTDDFIVKKAKYSYSELIKVMDILNKYAANNDISDYFPQYYLSDKDNAVIVELVDMSSKQIQLFKENVLNSDVISFKQLSGTPVDDVAINPGERISVSPSTIVGSGSVGFRAKWNGKNGIVTAGHVATSIAMPMYIGSTNIGKVKIRQYSGSVDAAFVEVTNSSYTPSNILNGTSTTLSTTISAPPVGTFISKRGTTTGFTSGKILSTNYSFTGTSNGITATFTNLTSANYSSASGDSGGIVYMYNGSTGKYPTLGIHKGHNSSVSCYVKANQINSAFGTSRY